MTATITVDGTTALIGTGETDVFVKPHTRDANRPGKLVLSIPIARDDLAALLVDADNRVIPDAVVELEWEGTLFPRMSPTFAQLAGTKAIEVTVQDRLYELMRRLIAAIGPQAALNDPFPSDVGTLGDWVLTNNGGGTITITPGTPTAPAPGNTGPTSYTISDDTQGPDWFSWVEDIPPLPCDRVLSQTFFAYLHSGAWSAPNANGLFCEIVATDVDPASLFFGEVVDAAQWEIHSYDPTDVWQIPHPILTIPSRRHYSLDFRFYTQLGEIEILDPRSGVQLAFGWDNLDNAQRIRDLIALANDPVFGHSDSLVRVDGTSCPDTGFLSTRSFYAAESAKVFDGISEALTASQIWCWLEPQIDGTDLFHADEGATVTYVINDSNAELASWSSPGDEQTGVLRLTSPDSKEYNGEPRVIDYTVDGRLANIAIDPGRELAVPGPFGSYDPAAAAQTAGPVFSTHYNAMTATIRATGDLAGWVAAVASGDLRPGNVINDLVLAGGGPRGIAGDFRISSYTLDLAARTVTLDLDRIGLAGGS